MNEFFSDQIQFAIQFIKSALYEFIFQPQSKNQDMILFNIAAASEIISLIFFLFLLS
jgi:hypothetical protein